MVEQADKPHELSIVPTASAGNPHESSKLTNAAKMDGQDTEDIIPVVSLKS